MRITFVTYHLVAGGAERVMVNMANHWAALGRAVTILTLAPPHEPFFSLHRGVTVNCLGIAGESGHLARAVLNNGTRVLRLREAIETSHPDAVIGFLTAANVLTLLATRGLDLPVVVEEHTDPAVSGDSLIWRRLRSATYRHAAAVVVLSPDAGQSFPAGIRRRCVVIPNAIEVPPASAVQRGADGPKRLVALGRLERVKGFDRLLEAVALLAPAHPDWRLTIWGDGSERDALIAMRDRLGLAHWVELPGATTHPHDELRRADLFVMSSRREGFPMALGEAMACGLPAVSFDCPSGPRQLIRHEIDGLLVPDGDVTALAAALQRVMTDDALRAALASRAPEVLERFGAVSVMAQWDRLLARCGAAGALGLAA